MLTNCPISRLLYGLQGDPEPAEDRLLFERARRLLARIGLPSPVRLIGISVSGLCQAEAGQLDLFQGSAARRARLAQAVDRLAQRFGDRAVMPASLLERPKRR